MYKNIIILLIFIGIIFIVIEVVRNEQKCPQDKIIYRYIPRTMDEESESPAYITDIFTTMFSQPDPWINSIDNLKIKKQEDINKFFISQV